MNNFLSNVLDTSQITDIFILYLPKVFSTLLILILFWVFYKISCKAIARGLNKFGLEEALIKIVISNVYRILIIVFAVITALGQLGVNVAAAITGLGVVGVAIGFAAQESLSNIIAGFIILIDKPFVVGHWIQVNDQYGKVSNITLRTTRIRKRDNTYVILPNHEIINQTIVNHSKSGPVRIEALIGIAYKESIDEARTVLMKGLENVEGIMDEPAPDVVVEELGDSSVNLRVRVWIETPEQDEKARFSLVEQCKKALDNAKIEIPFPHMQLFIDGVKEQAAKSLRG